MGLFNNQIHEETVQNYANIIEVLKLKCGRKKHIESSFLCCLQAPTVNHNKSIGAVNIYSLNTQMIAIVVNNSHIKIVFYTILHMYIKHLWERFEDNVSFYFR